MVVVRVQLMMQLTQEPMVDQAAVVDLTALVHQAEQARQIKAMMVEAMVQQVRHIHQAAAVEAAR
jgi:hypothetical protein